MILVGVLVGLITLNGTLLLRSWGYDETPLGTDTGMSRSYATRLKGLEVDADAGACPSLELSTVDRRELVHEARVIACVQLVCGLEITCLQCIHS